MAPSVSLQSPGRTPIRLCRACFSAAESEISCAINRDINAKKPTVDKTIMSTENKRLKMKKVSD